MIEQIKEILSPIIFLNEYDKEDIPNRIMQMFCNKLIKQMAKNGETITFTDAFLMLDLGFTNGQIKLSLEKLE